MDVFYDWATPGTVLSDRQLRCITLPLHNITDNPIPLYLSVSLNGFDWTQEHVVS